MRPVKPNRVSWWLKIGLGILTDYLDCYQEAAVTPQMMQIVQILWERHLRRCLAASHEVQCGSSGCMTHVSAPQTVDVDTYVNTGRK
jgi:hypothetical protein